MAITTFEVYAYKSGNWNIDSVYNDKGQAMHEARVLLESRHLTAVKIIQEKFNEETGDSTSMVIFNETKHIEKPKHKTAPAKKKASQPKVKTASESRGKQGHPDLVKTIVKLVLILGGIFLGLLALVAFYVSTFS